MANIVPPQLQKKKVGQNAWSICTDKGELAPHCTTEIQRSIISTRRLTRNAEPAWVRTDYDLGNTPYEKRLVDSLLVQTYGTFMMDDEQCSECKKGNRMYVECRRIPGVFGGMCGNCKRDEKGWKCDIREDDGKTKMDRDEELEMIERPPSRRNLRQRGVINEEGTYMQKKYPQ